EPCFFTVSMQHPVQKTHQVPRGDDGQRGRGRHHACCRRFGGRRMRKISFGMTAACVLLAPAAVAAPPTRCPAGAVLSGTGCIDKYEASVWRVPNPTTVNRVLVNRIKNGTVTLAQLQAAGAMQLGISFMDYAPCAANGQNCADDIYAVSIAGVLPSSNITWFQ